MGKGQTIPRKWVREERGIEIEPESACFRPIDPALEVCRGVSISIHVFPTAFRVARVKIDTMPSGNQAQRGLEVIAQFVRRSRAPWKRACHRQPSTGCRSGAVKSPHIVALPAWQRDRNAREVGQCLLGLDSEGRVTFLRDIVRGGHGCHTLTTPRRRFNFSILRHVRAGGDIFASPSPSSSPSFSFFRCHRDRPADHRSRPRRDPSERIEGGAGGGSSGMPSASIVWRKKSRSGASFSRTVCFIRQSVESDAIGTHHADMAVGARRTDRCAAIAHMPRPEFWGTDFPPPSPAFLRDSRSACALFVNATPHWRSDNARMGSVSRTVAIYATTSTGRTGMPAAAR